MAAARIDLIFFALEDALKKKLSRVVDWFKERPETEERRRILLIRTSIAVLMIAFSIVVWSPDSFVSDAEYSCVVIPSPFKCSGFRAFFFASYFFCWCLNLSAWYFLDDIRASKLVTQPSLTLYMVFFWASNLLSFASGFLQPKGLFGSFISCLFIFWGWLLDKSLGLKTDTSLPSTMASIAMSMTLGLWQREPTSWWIMLVPGIMFSILTTMDYCIGDALLKIEEGHDSDPE